MINLSSLTTMVVKLDDEAVIKTVERALNLGTSPMEIVFAINEGLEKVGHLYENGDYSISDLMMAGVIFEEVLNLPKMEFKTNLTRPLFQDTILLGTIEGDIHDIGKTIFHSLAVSVGFGVIDLGVDVSPEVFLSESKRHKPTIVAISAILTNTVDSVQQLTSLLKNDPETKAIFIILGGSMVNLDIATITGVDAYAKSAKEGVSECIRLKRTLAKLRKDVDKIGKV